ncbi:hypothetical protein IFM47457_03522 [Aspergillus lentulus]|nr:hypothetical protein IFM47457_03522 [Aspergillus lentulus]
MAGADTAEGEKSTARNESPALHTTTQSDALSKLHEEDKYLHGRALVLMTLSLMHVLTGAGYGAMVQIPMTALQVVLSAADIPLGSTLVILAQCLGSSVGLAVAENLLALQGVDVAAVEAAGGAELQDIVPVDLLGPVRRGFQVTVSDASLVAVGLGGAAFLASLGMERKRIMAKGGEAS